MPPALTLGDMTAHGTPLAPGPGGKCFYRGKTRLACISEYHTCPLVDVLKPHVGGVVAMGNTRVFINGLPVC